MKDLPRTDVAFIVLGAAFVMFAIGVAGYRSRYARGQLRRMYVDPRAPIFFRHAGPHAFLIAGAAAIFGCLVLLPRGLAQWLSIPVIGLALVTFVASSRFPSPFLPRWLRAEIDSCATPIARPDRWDWLLFWIVTPTFVLGALALVALIVFYAGGTAGR